MEKVNCPFCNPEMIKSTLFEFDDCFVFTPLNPVVEGHLLVTPKEHVADFTENPYITSRVMHVASIVASQKGGEYNLITSKGKSATQSVFHLHVHLVPRKPEDRLLLPWSNQKKHE